ncbi:hypothetical protein D3C77_418930 [compost metagenome]
MKKRDRLPSFIPFQTHAIIRIVASGSGDCDRLIRPINWVQAQLQLRRLYVNTAHLNIGTYLEPGLVLYIDRISPVLMSEESGIVHIQDNPLPIRPLLGPLQLSNPASVVDIVDIHGNRLIAPAC